MTQHPATLVPEERRPAFLPELFGVPMLIVAENTVYAMMDRLSPRDYGGGHWNFYEDRGQPLFLAPTSKPRLRIEGEITCFEGEVSAEAAGIIATLFTFLRRWPRWRFARSGPHKGDGVERHFSPEASRTPIDCQAIFLSPLADIMSRRPLRPADPVQAAPAALS